jgi:hypothetical protein
MPAAHGLRLTQARRLGGAAHCPTFVPAGCPASPGRGGWGIHARGLFFRIKIPLKVAASAHGGSARTADCPDSESRCHSTGPDSELPLSS